VRLVEDACLLGYDVRQTEIWLPAFRSICKKEPKNAHFFIINLIKLFCLRRVLNNQEFIIRRTVQAALWYFIMQLYKQPGRCHDVCVTTHIVTSTRYPAYMET
jgi:hypothetical protein